MFTSINKSCTNKNIFYFSFAHDLVFKVKMGSPCLLLLILLGEQLYFFSKSASIYKKKNSNETFCKFTFMWPVFCRIQTHVKKRITIILCMRSSKVAENVFVSKVFYHQLLAARPEGM